MDKEIKIIDDLYNVILQLGSEKARTVWNNLEGRRAVLQYMMMLLGRSDYYSIFHPQGRPTINWTLIIGEENNPPECVSSGKMQIRFELADEITGILWTRNEEVNCKKSVRRLDSLKELIDGDWVWVLERKLPIDALDWGIVEVSNVKTANGITTFYAAGYGQARGISSNLVASIGQNTKAFLTKTAILDELRRLKLDIANTTKRIEDYKLVKQ